MSQTLHICYISEHCINYNRFRHSHRITIHPAKQTFSVPGPHQITVQSSVTMCVRLSLIPVFRSFYVPLCGQCSGLRMLLHSLHSATPFIFAFTICCFSAYSCFLTHRFGKFYYNRFVKFYFRKRGPTAFQHSILEFRGQDHSSLYSLPTVDEREYPWPDISNFSVRETMRLATIV